MYFNFQSYVAIAVLFLMLIIIVGIIKTVKRSVKNQIKQALKPYSQADLQAITIPDGVGGLIDIERLVQLEQGLLIIETLPMSGNLFGADKIEQWTQMINGKSFKFTNPLYRTQTLRQALQVLAPNTPIFCRIIFTANDSVFPKGKPEEVSTLVTLQQDLQFIKQLPMMTQKQQANWEKILRIARKDGRAIKLGKERG